jgi:hypothetical protein
LVIHMHWVSCHSGKLLTSATKEESSHGRTFCTRMHPWDAIAPEKGLACGAIHELLHEPEDPSPLFVSLVMGKLATNLHESLRIGSAGWALPTALGMVGRAHPQDFCHPERTREGSCLTVWQDPSRSTAQDDHPSVDQIRVHSCALVAPIVICDPERQVYPPAIASMGIPLNQVFLIHPASPADELWAMTESLRCKGIGAVIAAPRRLDRTQARRLQLAAEIGGGIGIFLRPLDRNAEIYSAVTRWLVKPAPGERAVQKWRIQLLHGHGGQVGSSFILERNRETHLVRAAAEFSNRSVEANLRLASG